MTHVLVDPRSFAADALAGLGVHGEAGIAERPIATAHELSTLLVDGIRRPLAQRSLGHPDAGAVSLALCARTVAEALELEGTRND